MEKLCSLFLQLCACMAFAEASQPTPPDLFREGETIAFVGGTDMVRMQQEGRLEAGLTFYFRDLDLKFRDYAWEGDTVFFQSTVRERWRKSAFGDWDDQLSREGVSVVIAQFGKMESMKGGGGLPDFKQACISLISELKGDKRRVILLEPFPLVASKGTDEDAFARSMQSVAEELGCAWIPFQHENPINGYISELTGHPEPDSPTFNNLRRAVIEKHRLWYEYWRPANWKCLFGDDSRRIFSNATLGLPSLQDEWAKYPELIERAESQLWERGFQPDPRPSATGSPDADIQEELKSFALLDGFRIELFADEHHGIANPLSVRWDAMGRMYVACSEVYPQIIPGQRPYDTIMRLEDTDGDGRADDSKVFASGLNIPTGMEVGVDEVYVGQGTELLRLRDTDGDGVADERELVLSGFGNGDSHQTINSFIWGPGGDLWFCQGDGIESRVETPHGIASLYQAGVFRLDPHELRLDGLLDDFMGPGNPWGVAFDDFGQSFVIDGAGGVSFLTPGFIPVKRRLKLPTIGKPGGYCGIECIGGSTFEAFMQGEFLIGDYKKNQVSRFATVRDGAGFKVQWRSPLLHSSHPNFRPIDVKIGPDGAIYIVDWYNPVTCHQDDYFRHPLRDKTHGRIWRVTYENTSLKPPQLTDLNNQDLVNHLDSPERWVRTKVKQMLAARRSGEVIGILHDWLAGPDVSSIRLMEAGAVLDWMDTPDTVIWSKLMQAPDPRVRAFAVRLAGKWQVDLLNVQTKLEMAARDTDPLVRLESILAAAHLQSAEGVRVVAIAAESSRDQWIDYSLTQAVHYLKPYWLPALKEGKLNLSDFPEGFATILEIVGSKQLLEEVRTLLQNENTPADTRSTLLQTLAAVGTDEDVQQLLTSHFQHEAVLRVLSERERPDIELVPLLNRAFELYGNKVPPEFLSLIGKWNVRPMHSSVLAFTRSEGIDHDRAVAAIQTLGTLGEDTETVPLLIKIIASPETELKREAFEACFQLDPERAAALAGKQLVETVDHDAIRQLFQIVTKRSRWSELVVNSLERLHPNETQQSRLESIWLSSGWKDAHLSKLMRGWSGAITQTRPYSPEVLQIWIKEGKKGHPAKGKEIFESLEAGCSACHRVDQTGGTIGPDLSALGSSVPQDRIVTEVLWPHSHVKEGYSLSMLTLKNGEILQGYLQAYRDPSWVMIRSFADGEIVRIKREKVTQINHVGSLMPDTAQRLSDQELGHLLSYLFHLGPRNSVSE